MKHVAVVKFVQKPLKQVTAVRLVQEMTVKLIQKTMNNVGAEFDKKLLNQIDDIE